MGGVFISYRRADAEGSAGRICDRLTGSMGSRRVFMDTQSLKPGVDFQKEILAHLSQCDVVLVVIGPSWLARPAAGAPPRLFDQNDLVRLEVATALHSSKRVIPVLVQGARMPPAGELPDDLQALSSRNAFAVSAGSFDDDCRRLLRAITGSHHLRRWPMVAVGAALLAAGTVWALGPLAKKDVSPPVTRHVDSPRSPAPADAGFVVGGGTGTALKPPIRQPANERDRRPPRYPLRQTAASTKTTMPQSSDVGAPASRSSINPRFFPRPLFAEAFAQRLLDLDRLASGGQWETAEEGLRDLARNHYDPRLNLALAKLYIRRDARTYRSMAQDELRRADSSPQMNAELGIIAAQLRQELPEP